MLAARRIEDTALGALPWIRLLRRLLVFLRRFEVVKLAFAKGGVLSGGLRRGRVLSRHSQLLVEHAHRGALFHVRLLPFFNFELAVHEIVDEPLAAVEVRSQVVADLDQPVALLL